MRYSWFRAGHQLHAIPDKGLLIDSTYYWSICGVKIGVLETMQGPPREGLMYCKECQKRVV